MHLILQFELAGPVTINAKRVTLQEKDMQLIQQIQRRLAGQRMDDARIRSKAYATPSRRRQAAYRAISYAGSSGICKFAGRR